MKVHHLQCLRGAAKSVGITVVIDVFRASSTIVTLLARGAGGVVPVEKIEHARRLKEAHPDWILAGEREGLPPEGFEFGNSPAQAERIDCRGKTIILATSAGTRGLVKASQYVDTVLVGCFLNAGAIVDYIKTHEHKEVSIIAMGVGGEVPSPEDNLAAQYIEMLLAGIRMDMEEVSRQIREHPEGHKFLDPQNTVYTPEDYHACLRVDTYPVVPILIDGKLTLAAGR